MLVSPAASLENGELFGQQQTSKHFKYWTQPKPSKGSVR
jgi:hypothetical protein